MDSSNEQIVFSDNGNKSKEFSNEGSTVLKLNSTSVVIKKNKNTIDLKLFVGQLPKNWAEKDVESFFSTFGKIIDTQVLRDKTGNHKGCAFVKFASMTMAEKAIEKLDKKLELPGSNASMQIKWADGEPERLGIDPETIPKLFIGSLPKEANEQNLRDLFEQFGTIEELHLMKESDGITSKGSGFIRYALQESALLAIRNLHAQAYILNSDRPIEVRLAENKKKEKSANFSMPIPPPPSLGEEMWHGPQVMFPPFSPMQMQMQMPMYNMYYSQYMNKEGLPYYNPMTMAALPPGSMIYPGTPENKNSHSSHHHSHSPPTNLNDLSNTGVKKQGPNGSNLFIFHIPNTWKDSDLYNLFSPYGAVVSARIMTDKKEGKSRGFGFISYETPQSAKLAIENLNGFQVDNKKRLKVQLKQGGDDGMSNLHPNKFAPF